MTIVTGRLDVQAQEISVMSDSVTFLTEHGVTFQDLSNPNSRTIINGGNIKTGEISCSRLAMGATTIGTETYTLAWRKAMFYDTQTLSVLSSLGYTIRTDNITTVLYFHFTKDATTGFISDITINSDPVGADDSITFIGPNNVLYDPMNTNLYHAYGPDSSHSHSVNLVCFEESPSGTGAAYRAFIASDDRISNSSENQNE